MEKEQLEDVFAALKLLLEKHARGMDTTPEIPGSQAKERKPGYHLYGKRAVSIGGRKPQRTYVVGIIQQKIAVGFYSMPLHSHPAQLTLSPDLEKCRSGKSCLQIKSTDPALLKQLEAHLVEGIELYRKEGWI